MSNAQPAEKSEKTERCGVCDGTEGEIIAWPQGAQAHWVCAPGHWRKDRTDQEEFTAAMHRVHYRLTDDGKVEADCLKCDWWMTDWPNGVGDMYRKAQRHVKGERDSS